MSDDLVKRLREVTGGKLQYTNTPNHLRIEAADRIEELEAKLRWVLDERDATFALMLNRAETAEAKLAKAVEALRFYAYVDDDQGIRARTVLEEMGVMEYE